MILIGRVEEEDFNGVVEIISKFTEVGNDGVY